MYNLFLETKAARQIAKYCEDKGLGIARCEELLKSCYEGKKEQGFGNADMRRRLIDADKDTRDICYDEWWVTSALDGNAHKRLTVDSILNWGQSKEGHQFWYGIYVHR